MTTLQELGENGMISRIIANLRQSPDLLVGAGDDTAVVRMTPDSDLLLTSDPVVEGIHFEASAYAPDVGHKAVARALSDIAAMGGDAGWILINIVSPRDIHSETIDGIYEGASAVANEYGAAIVGGDITEGKVLELHVFVTGTVPAGKAILRSGAHPGDAFFVTGELGGSITGKHLRFTPRLKEGRALRGWASAMIDLSDGMATDLPRLTTASSIGAQLVAASIPVSSSVITTANTTPLDHAIGDGEDFELLFTIPSHKECEFLKYWEQTQLQECTRIGEATQPCDSIMIIDRNGDKTELTSQGYEHFKN